MYSDNQILETNKSSIKNLSSSGSKHVAIVMGGMSHERDVSIISAKGVTKALLELGYRVTEIDMNQDFASVIKIINPDVVFNCLHGTYGEDGCVPGILNILKIPYTHSGVLASAIAFDKIKSKEIMKANNIPIIPGIIISKNDYYKQDPIPRPYVIKPVAEGSSIGIHIIFEGDKFSFADYSFDHGEKIIIEQYIKGRELQIAILNSGPLEILEIELLNKRFYDYEAKYTEGFTRHILPASLPEHIRRQVLDISSRLYDIFGVRGIARAEMIYSEEEDKVYVLEINTHPGMTPLSICPEIAAYCGISFNELIKQLVDDARYD
ncbi:MAG: D-alanine--D-alanine ligase [Alphaproteobacteria bacterium]|nr:D-alanine--D-alanine ligase [Alphaproteobacteria bacterium]